MNVMSIYTEWMVAGAVVSLVLAVFVMIEYTVLVNIWKNPMALRLASLLLSMIGILGATVARMFFADYPGRNEILTIFFWLLAGQLCWMGWQIANDQIKGAARRRVLEQLRAERKSPWI